MTINSLRTELEKLPDDYEIIFSGHKDISEREISLVISHKEKFVILKYKSFQ